MKYIKRGKWQGFRQLGTVPISTDNRKTHLRKASWLTAMVESGGKFACVINFDQTGITAGLHQATAVLPAQIRKPDGITKNDQGPLWRLLDDIRVVAPDDDLWDLIDSKRWLIVNGKLRHLDGGFVSGPDILDELAGSPDGRVPPSGAGYARSKRWVEAVHLLMANPRTFAAQEGFGMAHFKHRANHAKLRFAGAKHLSYTVSDAFYRDYPVDIETFELNPELDLALCVYWSHSVNAPSMALSVLCRALIKWEPTVSTEAWARHFIRRIALTKYGRWHESERNGRYDRTRRYALESGFWPRAMVKAIMPERF
jgi:hypothetical protein